MSRNNNQGEQGVQQTKDGPLDRLNGIQLELRTIQRGRQEQQQQQDETVSSSITTDTEPDTDTSPQSINPRNQRGFFSSFGPTSSTSVDNRQEQYDYFNDPTITQEERARRTEVRDISQAHVREVNPNLDLEKWRKDYEARMRRLSFNRRNRRLGNVPNNEPRGLTSSTSFENDLDRTSSRGLFLGGRYASDMSSLVIPDHFGTTSSTSGANDLALLNGPDQNNVEPLGGNLVTSNIQLEENLVTSNTPIRAVEPPRINTPATLRNLEGKKRRRQKKKQDSGEPPQKRRNTNP